MDNETNATVCARFWAKVQKEPDGCWMWTGNPNQSGYSKFRLGGTGSRTTSAHQFSYRMHVGPVKSWQQLHHKCERSLCVNPDHLVVTVNGEHRRQLHHKKTCANGHDLTVSQNVYSYRGQRLCRPCRRMNVRRQLGITQDRWKIADEY